MKIEKKTFIVTGGGSGVGRELVLQLLRQKANVAAIDVNENALKETFKLAEGSPGLLSVYVADISDRNAIESLPPEILKAHPSIDVIINNAGIIHPFKSVYESDYSTIQRVFNINFFGTLHLIKTFLPYLLDQQNGYIVNVSSFGALSPVPGETIYGASKAAVKMLSAGLQMELKNTNVRVMTVLPGGINSNIIANSDASSHLEINRLRERFSFLLLTPKKAAYIIIKGIEKNREKIVIGIDAKLIDFLSRFSPRFSPKRIYGLIDKILKS